MNYSQKQLQLIQLSSVKAYHLDKVLSFLLQVNYNINEVFEKINFYNKNKDYKIFLPSMKDIENEIKQMNDIGGSFLFYDDEIYPSLLRNIETFPICLRCIGNVDLLKNNKKISIVGTRRPDLKAIRVTKKIIKHLTSHNFITISGLARGIDSLVHEESLQSGTISVIGSGFLNIYPKENESLFNEIIQNNGLILSELKIDENPMPDNFPRRNRIIAGLSKDLIVSQASLKSGTLITAKLATQYNRNVYTLPGDLENESWFGNNYIITHNIGSLIEDINSLYQQIEENHFF
jgi:DNA processing protein